MTLGESLKLETMVTLNPDGTVYKWYENNDWKPADLIQDAEESLQQENQRTAGPHSSSATVPNA